MARNRMRRDNLACFVDRHLDNHSARGMCCSSNRRIAWLRKANGFTVQNTTRNGRLGHWLWSGRRFRQRRWFVTRRRWRRRTGRGRTIPFAKHAAWRAGDKSIFLTNLSAPNWGRVCRNGFHTLGNLFWPIGSYFAYSRHFPDIADLRRLWLFRLWLRRIRLYRNGRHKRRQFKVLVLEVGIVPINT